MLGCERSTDFRMLVRDQGALPLTQWYAPQVATESEQLPSLFIPLPVFGHMRAQSPFRSVPTPMFGFGQGFTLIELLVVITVIGILATLVAPSIFQHVGAAKDATARSQIEMLGAALDAYRLDNGRYPTTQQGLDALWNSPTAQPRAAN